MNQPNTPIDQRLREYGVILMLLVFFPAIWLMIAFLESSERSERITVLRQLEVLSSEYVLEVNGQKVDNPARIIADLKNARPDPFNHAPGRNPQWYRVEIRDQKQVLRLLLTRDEHRIDKYWVFRPGDPLGARIGSFIDSDLSALLPIQ